MCLRTNAKLSGPVFNVNDLKSYLSSVGIIFGLGICNIAISGQWMEFFFPTANLM